MRVLAAIGVLACACSYTPRPLDELDAPTVPGPDAPPGTPDARVFDAPPGTPDARTPDAAMTVTCPGTYNLDYGGHKYRAGHDTWYNAETSCEADGEHLIVIDDGGELFAADLVTLGDFWLGMSDHVVEGTFRWLTTGATVNSGWRLGEPNNSGNNEDCGSFVPGLGGGYNDDDCTRQHDYLCECDGQTVAPLAWCVTDLDTACETCNSSHVCN